MDAAPVSTAPGELTLGAGEVRALFPFFLRFDRDLRVVDAGAAAHKVCPGLRPGAAFEDLFRLFRPRVRPSFDAFARGTASTFLLDALGTDIRMRGQMLHREAEQELLFVGTPWLTDIDQLRRTGLELKDFTIHDPNVDFLYMVQAKTLALEDARRFGEVVAQQRDDLTRTNARLAQALAVKTQFLANTSHELRTPLNGIIGMASLLARSEIGPKQKNYADVILKSANALLTIVNDLLDFAKMEAGKLTLEPVDFDVRRFAYDVAEVFAIAAQSKNLELVCAIEEDVPQAVRGDPIRLRQVVSNLVGNAVKFTPHGEIVLRISVVERAGSSALLRFCVKDTGPGIAEGDRGRLFQAFSQVDGTSAHRHGGTGLGLAISRELAALMGGDIGVDSEPGEGSAFWFTARLQVVTDMGAERPHRRDFGGMRALVLDDNATNREYLLDVLSHWGMRVDGAGSAPLALELLRSAADAGRPHDVGIFDDRMPGMTGRDLAMIVANDARLKDLRVLLMSSIDKVEPPGSAVRIDAYLTKPVRPSSLFDCMASLLLAGEAPTPSKRAAAVAAVVRPALDARILVVDDNAVNLEVAARMLEALGYSFDLVENGQQALGALRRSSYAAVLMDLQMPVMDGYEATREIRRREGDSKRTAIIVTTAHAMATDRQRALDLGADDYISKPIDFDALGALLARWVTSAPRPAPAPERAPDASLGAALEELRRYQAPGAPDIVASVVRKFLISVRDRLGAVREAEQRGDLEEIARAGHMLKSSSPLVGAHRLAEACAALEAAARSGDHDRTREAALRFEADAEDALSALEAAVPGALRSEPPGG